MAARYLVGRRLRWALQGVIVFGLMLAPVGGVAATKNGFDLTDALVPVEDILHGGPPRDGIPAIDRPMFVMRADADYLRDDDRVLGVYRNGIAKAYPIAILNWHEIVNDRFGGEAVVVTFCPLCGTGMAFKATVGSKARRFGVSGLLYKSDVLLYDRESESLWSQIAGRAISGPLRETRLEMVPAAHTSWSDWRTRYPRTLVLSRKTGYARDYGRDPYAGYGLARDIFFPVGNTDTRYHPKEQVIGLEVNGRFKAYPFTELGRAQSPVRDQFAGRSFIIHYDAEHRTGWVAGDDGTEIPTVVAFWFAWSAFHPDTAVYKGS